MSGAKQKIFWTNNKFIISHLYRSNFPKIVPDVLDLFLQLEIGTDLVSNSNDPAVEVAVLNESRR